MNKKKILALASVALLVTGCHKKPHNPTSIMDNPLYLENLFSDTEEYKVKDIKNVIIIIGDGMGPNCVKAGQMFENKTYDFTKWQSTRSNTDSIREGNGNVGQTTDSAAGGTALSTGSLTINGRIARDKDKNDLVTLLETSGKIGKATGVVTTDCINGATPASFSAHADNRGDSDDIINSQATNPYLNLLIGNYFGGYETSKPLFETNGFTYSEVLDTSLLTKEKLIVNNKNMVPYGELNTLTDSVKYAVNYLEKCEKGFSLMIEQAHIDKYNHNNNFDGMVHSMAELNNTVTYLTEHFKNRNDTMILITADHDTGGIQITNDETYEHKFVVDGKACSYEYRTTGHTNTPVPVYVKGPKINFNMLKAFRNSDLIKNSEIGVLLKILAKNQ